MDLQYYKSVKKKYKTFPLQKKSGKIRWIDAPDQSLKIAQHDILVNFLYLFSAHPAAMGFVRGIGVQDGAKKHIGSSFVINLDLSNFFNSIKKPRIIKLFHHLLLRYEEMGNKLGLSFEELRDLLVYLCIYKNRLPQGACTSPAIANLIASPLDETLSEFANENNLEYSRYADDLTFSGKEKIDFKIINEIKEIIQSHNFIVNEKKTTVKTSNKRMVVTGIVVNKQLGISKWKKKVFRATLHNLLKNNISVSLEQYQKLRGYAEWVKTLNPTTGKIFLNQIMRLQMA